MFHLSLCAVTWKITEGSTVSVNYVSGSSGDRIEKMFLSKRSLKAGSRLIVDDFLKRGGGTVNGMISLLREFDSELAGRSLQTMPKKNVKSSSITSHSWRLPILMLRTNPSMLRLEISLTKTNKR